MRKLPLVIFLLPVMALAGNWQVDQVRELARAKKWPEVVGKVETGGIRAQGLEQEALNFIYGYALQQTGNYRGSVHALAAASKNNSPARDYALYYLAVAEDKLARKYDAAKTLKKISGDSYIYLPARMFLAGIYLDTGRIDDAAAELCLLKLEALPGELAPELVLLEGRAALAEGALDRAAEKFALLRVSYPLSDAAMQLERKPELNAEQTLTRAGNLMAARSYRAAAAELEDLLSNQALPPEMLSELYGLLARARFGCRDYRSVVRLEPQAKKPAGENPEFWYYLGWAYQRLDKDSAAERAYLKCAHKFPDSPFAGRALYNLAKLEQGKNRHWLAQQYYRQLLREHPASELAEDAQFESGLIYYGQKDYAKAIEVLELSGMNEKDPARVKYWLYKSHEQTGQRDKAAEISRALVKDFPASAYAYLVDPCPGPGIIARNASPSPEAGAPAAYRAGLFMAWSGMPELARRELRWQMQRMRASDGDLVMIMDKLREFHAYQLLFDVYNSELAGRLAPGESSAYYQYLFPLAFPEMVVAKAEKYQVDPALAYSLIRQESAFDPMATSSAGAIGLTQVMPFLAKKVSRTLGYEVAGPEQFYDIELNLEMGMYHFSGLAANYKNSGPDPWPLLLAVAAYNAGAKPVDKWYQQARRKKTSPDLWIEQIPYGETRGYVKRILANMRIYRASIENRGNNCP